MNETSSSDSDQSDQEDSSKIPVIVMDQHHRAYEMIKRYIKKGLLLKHNNTIIHLDAHIDDLVPQEIQIRAQLESKLSEPKLFHDIGAENWLKNAVNDNCIKHVIWVKPPWAIQVEDGHIDLDNNATIDIKTLGKSIFDKSEENYNEFLTLFSKYLNPGDPYILDIEYNFFSSDSPFTSDYTRAKDYYTHLKDLFELKIPANKVDYNNAADERNQQLIHLQKIFDYLEQNRQLPTNECYPPDLYGKVSNFREYLLKFYAEDKLNWKDIFNGGVVSNDHQLPVHRTSREDINRMLQCVGKMLDVLVSPPTLITIAIMYEYDRFTPLDTCDFIAEVLQEFFENRYDNVDFKCDDF